MPLNARNKINAIVQNFLVCGSVYGQLFHIELLTLPFTVRGVNTFVLYSFCLLFVGPCIIVITEEKKQLVATYYFIVLLIGSTYFGHYYAHHQDPGTVPVSLGSRNRSG